MKRKKALAVLLTLGMALGMLSGCGSEPSADKAGQPADAAAEKDTTGETQEAKGSEGDEESAQAGNVNAEGFPIVNEQITLRVFGQQGPVQAKWDTMGMWKKYQEMTNINLDFTGVLPAEGYDEKKSLMWASNEYPDIFVRAQLNNSEIVKYGSMGILAPLEDLIPVYAPNMQKLIDEDPAILSRITAPDGHIYALPAVFTLTAARDDKFWMNKSWLEQVGKEVPETVDELEEVLRSFKGVDFNGNGEADEYPMGISDASALIRRFAGVWGYQYQFGTYLEVKDGKVSTYLTDDGFKEELQWLAKMYGEGLIDPEIFTQEYAKYAAKMAGQQMGLFFNQADDTFDSSSFVGIAPFKGKADRQYVESAPAARDNGVFAICADCENKEAAMRWIDYFYGYEGSILMRYGVEGENMYFDEEGKPHYNDGILDSPEGSGTEIGKYTIWPGGGAPQWVNNDNCEAIASEATLKAQEALDPCLPEQIYAAPLLEQEVSDRLSVLWTDLESYMKETTAKLIRGELNFEGDWDTYVETMNKIGLEEWVSIYQAAYDVIGE